MNAATAFMKDQNVVHNLQYLEIHSYASGYGEIERTTTYTASYQQG